MPWLRWVAAWVAPFLAGLAAAELLALVGATPAPPPAPVPPEVLPLDGAALGVLAGVGAAMALGLLLGRFLAARPDPRLRRARGARSRGGARARVERRDARALAGEPLRRAARRPGGPLGCSVLVAGVQPRRRVRALLVALGALPALIVALYYLIALRIDPLSGAWYLLLLVTGHTRRPGDGAGRLRDAGRALRVAGARATARRAEAPRARREDEPARRRSGPGFALRR